MFRFTLRNLRKVLMDQRHTPVRCRLNTSTLRLESLEERTVPSTVNVGPGQQYTTINAALTAAEQPGSSINQIDVYPGTYHETVKMTVPSLQLVSEGTANNPVIIQPTTVATDTINGVNVGSAAIDILANNISIQGFTIDGSQANGNLFVGIRVIEGGAASNIANNVVENIVNASNSNSNIGIDIGISQLGSSLGAGSAINIQQNTILNCAGAGVLVDGTTAYANDIQNNTITGRGTANGGSTEFGIQVSNGGLVPLIQNNTISANTIDGSAGAPNNPSASSAGIWFYNDSLTAGGGTHETVQSNTLTGNDDGILIQSTNGDNSDLAIQNNTITGNYGYAGIFILSSTGIAIQNDKIENNLTFNGLALNFSSNVFVQNEQISNNGTFGTTSSQTDGVYDQNGTDNTFENIQSTGNSGNGYNLVQSNGDTLTNNKTQVSGPAESNVLYGLQIIGGTNFSITNNQFQDNTGGGMFLSGLTGTPESDGHGNMLTSTITVINNQANDNIGDGIDLSNDTGILFTNNQASDNGYANGNTSKPVAFSSGFVLLSSVTNCYFSQNITVRITQDGSGNDLAQQNAGNGFYVVDATSTGNVITGNTFQNNANNYTAAGYFDILDNSGGENSYFNNNFRTSSGSNIH